MEVVNAASSSAKTSTVLKGPRCLPVLSDTKPLPKSLSVEEGRRPFLLVTGALHRAPWNDFRGSVYGKWRVRRASTRKLAQGRAVRAAPSLATLCWMRQLSACGVGRRMNLCASEVVHLFIVLNVGNQHHHQVGLHRTYKTSIHGTVPAHHTLQYRIGF